MWWGKDDEVVVEEDGGEADGYSRRFRSPVATGGDVGSERRTNKAAAKTSRPIRSAGKLGDVDIPSSSWAASSSSSSSAAGPLALPAAAALVSGANGAENLGDEDGGVGNNSGGSSGGSGAAASWESSVKSDLIDCEAIYRVKWQNNCLYPPY